MYFPLKLLAPADPASVDRSVPRNDPVPVLHIRATPYDPFAGDKRPKYRTLLLPEYSIYKTFEELRRPRGHSLHSERMTQRGTGRRGCSSLEGYRQASRNRPFDRHTGCSSNERNIIPSSMPCRASFSRALNILAWVGFVLSGSSKTHWPIQTPTSWRSALLFYSLTRQLNNNMEGGTYRISK